MIYVVNLKMPASSCHASAPASLALRLAPRPKPEVGIGNGQLSNCLVTRLKPHRPRHVWHGPGTSRRHDRLLIAVTSARRAEELCVLLRRQGAEVCSAPAIKMIALPDDDELQNNTELIADPPDTWSPTPAGRISRLAGPRRG